MGQSDQTIRRDRELEAARRISEALFQHLSVEDLVVGHMDIGQKSRDPVAGTEGDALCAGIGDGHVLENSEDVIGALGGDSFVSAACISHLDMGQEHSRMI